MYSLRNQLWMSRKKIRLDASEPDARLRILMLRTAYVSICKRHGWSFIETAQKGSVKHLMSVLLLPILKTHIEIVFV